MSVFSICDSVKAGRRMDYILLGKTNLLVSRTALGAMALANVPGDDAAAKVINLAYESGVNFFDTARSTEESERRLGKALHGSIRKDIFIATKTRARDSVSLAEDIDQSLTTLETDYIDLYQLDNPPSLPDFVGSDGIVDTLLKFRAKGVIHHFGIATESLEIARAALYSSVDWETIQFPFNILCGSDIEELSRDCEQKNIGFIGMKPLSGGVISNIPLALGYIRRFENVIPVWGVHNDEELRQILYFAENPPRIDEQFKAEAEKLRMFFN